jgi:AcrR family transcriptional regulator
MAQAGTAHRFQPPAPPKTPKSARTRRRILELSGAMFVERGYHGVSLRDVAEAAGLTKSALYGHFRSKGQLLVEVIRWRLADREQSPEYLEALDDVGTSVELMFAEAGREIRLLEVDAASAARHDPDVAAGLRALYGERNERIRDAMAGTADPEATAWLVRAITAGVGVTEATGPSLPDHARLHGVLTRAMRSVAELDERGARS